MAEETLPQLTIDFVSKLIGKPIESFTIKPGSAPGDNYMSVLYSLECKLVGSEETVYALCKCYPTHHVRQKHLNRSNAFWRELYMYKKWIPALQSVAPDHMSLPFAPLISGEAINFETWTEVEKDAKVLTPFENYIAMVDMRKTFGLRMADRGASLGLTEVTLIMKEYAKIHALSWAYKIKNKHEDDLSAHFPFYKISKMETWLGIMNGIFETAINTLKPIGDLELVNSVVNVKDKMGEILTVIFAPKATGAGLERLHRIRVEKQDEEMVRDPWLVVTHGDCWVNNFLFQYEEGTKNALDVVIVDLPVMREACLTFDLAYILYSATTTEFRQTHLNNMLRLYAEQFSDYCNSFGVKNLPGFNYESLLRQFHTSKLMGFVMAMLDLPALYKDAEKADYLDQSKVDSGLAQLLLTAIKGAEGTSGYRKRLLELVKELRDDGVL